MRTKHRLRRPAVLLAGALVLVACGDSSQPTSAPTSTATPDEHPSGDGATEVPAALRRLVVADAAGARLLLLDLDGSGDELELDLPAPASHASAVTEDDRFLLLAHDDGVTVVDGGTWSEGHGDHHHHFVGEPAVVGAVEGARPTHLISHGGTTALWFDGLGEAVLLDGARLAAEGAVAEVGRVPSASPHHGFAIPFGQTVVMTEPPPEGAEMPDRVVVADRAGVAESSHACRQTHGEASWDGAAAVACADGVLVLEEADGAWTSRLLGYPSVDDEDPYGYGAARAWLLRPVDDGQRLVAPLGERHVLVLDVASGVASAIDLGAPVGIFGVRVHEGSGHLVVLTDDGAAQLVDPDIGRVVHRVEVLEPTEGHVPDEPYRMLVVSGDEVFVSDPDREAVVTLTVAEERLVPSEVHDLGFAPAYLEVVNG